MAYRMTFRFDEHRVEEKDLMVVTEDQSLITPMPMAVKRPSRILRRKVRIGKFEWIVAIFFVVFVVALAAAIQGRPFTASKASVVPATILMQPELGAISQLSATHHLLILPPIHVWVASEGVYSNKGSAMMEVKANLANGVSSFVTARPPYQVLLAALLTPAQVKMEEVKWTRAEVPFYLANMNINQSVKAVPYLSHAQVKTVEQALFQDYTQIMALIQNYPSVTIQIQKVKLAGNAQSAQTSGMMQRLNQLSESVQQAESLAKGDSTKLGSALAKAIVAYQGF